MGSGLLKVTQGSFRRAVRTKQWPFAFQIDRHAAVVHGSEAARRGYDGGVMSAGAGSGGGQAAGER